MTLKIQLRIAKVVIALGLVVLVALLSLTRFQERGWETGGVDVRLVTLVGRKALLFSGPKVKSVGAVTGAHVEVFASQNKIRLTTYRVSWLPGKSQSLGQLWPIVYYVDDLPSGRYDVEYADSSGVRSIHNISL
jgi:hypothetical protein